MIKSSLHKGREWLTIARKKLSKARNGIPSKYMRRPWPSGNKIREN